MKMEDLLKYWRRGKFPLSVAQCDLCATPFSNGDLVVDAPIRADGRWAHMCGSCAMLHGARGPLGTVHMIQKAGN